MRMCSISREHDISTCESGLCVPPIIAPFGDDSNLCVWRDGDHACPVGFPASNAYYRSIVDGRTCAGCSCSPQGAACTNAHVSLVAGDGSPNVTVHEGECVRVAYAPVQFDFTARAPIANTCGAVGTSAPAGDVHSADPVTVCCRG